ncbi:hypothetical protein NET02_03845 [Thermomicrobiaceae bacterium CFH 74404]|uniref:Uncharacterized protein n=1 Tax=Thermalbibacter longus TaxID=2951981 RepID=A0AA41WC52_9BACT|nr:hypothetical protein [Thermalbibacter longus]MCM8748268.1 hypothetical protein [Thermalbibacter longus]
MTRRSALARVSSIAGSLLATLVVSILLHAALYHTGHPGAETMVAAAVPASMESGPAALHHHRTPATYHVASLAEKSERCPAPDLIMSPVIPLGLAGPVALADAALAAEPAIRCSPWRALPERPPRVVLQRFLL